jgi:hypothetical protein
MMSSRIEIIYMEQRTRLNGFEVTSTPFNFFGYSQNEPPIDEYRYTKNKNLLVTIDCTYSDLLI